MSYALVDNATLTAVQRLLGKVLVRSRESVDGDIVALENLVEAILFYDEIICIDNYKAEYKTSRKKEFPFIYFLDPSQFQLDVLEEKALQEAQKFRPVICGGEFADEDFHAFLEQLKMHIICTWDISASVYYLTMKMLGQPNTEEFKKYGKISAAIFNELTDLNETNGRFDNSVTLIDSKGDSIGSGYRIEGARWGKGETGGMTNALSVFIASLNWIAFKTIYYCFAARYFWADVFLYPIRQSFQIRYMEKTSAYDFDFTQSLIQKMNARLKDEIEVVLNVNRPVPVSFTVPLFVAWLVQQTRDVKKVISAALELRKENVLAQAREQLREIRNFFDEKDLETAYKKMQKLLYELNKALLSIRDKFGLKTEQGINLSNLFQVYNTVATFTCWPTLPEIKGKISLPSFMKKFFKKKGFAVVYRNIGLDLSNVWKLGEIRDKLGEAVQIDSEAKAYIPRNEDPKFKGIHSKWKSPM